MQRARLWETAHPYYCSGHSGDPRRHQDVTSWAAFMEDSMGPSDEDYNMLFRWDWLEGEDHDLGPDQATLKLFFYLQRKAYSMSVYVSVKRTEEPQIYEWLAKRWNHTRRLWAPFSATPAT